jgi:hypothetical protein
MLTVAVLFRNMGRMTPDCVQILADSMRTLYLDRTQAEVIFVDDASDPGQEVVPMLMQLRQAFPVLVRILRFKTRQHYTRGLAHVLSAAKGHVLFVSHDMLVPRAYIRGVLEVAAMDDAFGIVRGVSTYVDVFPQHIVEPPGGVGNVNQLNSFADFVAQRWGLACVEDEFLTGDSMLIKRSVIEKIGVFDSKFFGYYGDIDYGLRAQRAGFKLVCAKGAWLFHQGAGFYQNESQRTGKPYEQIHAARMKVVEAAYQVFREKWSSASPIPADYRGTAEMQFAKLRAAAGGPGEYEAPLGAVAADVGEWL